MTLELLFWDLKGTVTSPLKAITGIPFTYCKVEFIQSCVDFIPFQIYF